MMADGTGDDMEFTDAIAEAVEEAALEKRERAEKLKRVLMMVLVFAIGAVPVALGMMRQELWIRLLVAIPGIFVMLFAYLGVIMALVAAYEANGRAKVWEEVASKAFASKQAAKRDVDT